MSKLLKCELTNTLHLCICLKLESIALDLGQADKALTYLKELKERLSKLLQKLLTVDVFIGKAQAYWQAK